ncbi:MAG: hypothetical protein RIA08_12200 [Roseovarius sp.]|uniref:hypothetical protein n=1 Tax=Roseovarius sp. TaxID=1486281 RepID=UPI0032EC6C3B
MKTTFTAAAIAALLAAGHATAQAYTSDGTARGQSQTEVIEVGADHQFMNVRATYNRFEMEDSTNPMNKLSGPCFGVLEVRGGAVEGNGVCVLDGLEGDRVTLGWNARRRDPQGNIHGYWHISSGSGLWLQASGGGTFMSSVNPANGTATNTLRGAVTLR